MFCDEELQLLRDCVRMLNHLIVFSKRMRSKYLDDTITNHPELYSAEFLREYHLFRAMASDESASASARKGGALAEGSHLGAVSEGCKQKLNYSQNTNSKTKSHRK